MLSEQAKQRRRENQKKRKYLRPKTFDIKDLTPKNAFRVMDARKQATKRGEVVEEFDYIIYG